MIDSTILSAFTDCPLKAFREYCLQLGPLTPSIHLHAGGAFARAIEIIRRAWWEKELNKDHCLDEGFKAFTEYWGDFEAPEYGSGSKKTYERMWDAVLYYFNEYPLDTDPIKPYEFPDGQRAIEFTFGIPLPISHPETGDPLIFGGRSDMIGTYNNMLAIIDEKTASALGDSWVKKWKMRGQFFGYVWAAREMGIPVSTAIIRGVSILKTKFNNIQVVETGYSDFMINRWYWHMLWKVEQFVEYFRDYKSSNVRTPEEVFPMAFGEACTNYGGCMFVDLCTSKEPTRWYDSYGTRRWNPLSKDPSQKVSAA